MFSVMHTRRSRAAVYCASFVFLCSSVATGSAQSSPPRYKGSKDQVVAYNVEIVADLTDKTETLKGVITYTVNQSADDGLNVTYRGGLGKTTKTKPGQSSGRSRPGFGRRRFGPPSFPRSPFSTVKYKGLITTSNEITLDPQGYTKTMKGDSQLPYLLGNLSLLIFEPLPEKAENSWEVAGGVTISSTSERQNGPPFLSRIPGSPFNRDEPEKTASGSQATSFTIRKDDGKTLTADKRYTLNSPSTDKGSYQITGNGTWVFNREEGVPESLDYKQSLKVKNGNVTVTIPVSIKYNRLTPVELAKYQEDQKQKQAEAQKRLAELREKTAKQRAEKAAQPLSEEDKQEILDGLISEKFFEVVRALQKLQRKKPENPDQEIAKIVRELFDHKNRTVQRLAKQVAEKWPVKDE